MNDITSILNSKQQDEGQLSEKLLPLVYDELRKLAVHKLRNEAPGITLQATALVHEAYLRLVTPSQANVWDGRGHFFAAAAESMRRILVENARRKQRLCHGGAHQRVQYDENSLATPDFNFDLIALDETLTRFEQIEPLKAQVVKLRYFGGLSMPEIAETLNVSLATVERWWDFSRSWLFAEMNAD